MLRKLIRNYISGILFGIIILVLSVVPISVGETTSRFIFPGFDKLVHAGMYFIFSALLTNDYLRANRGNPELITRQGNDKLISNESIESNGSNGFKKKKLFLLLSSAFAYSVLIELIQHLAPYRSGEVLDALANFGGILIGASVVYLWRKSKY